MSNELKIPLSMHGETGTAPGRKLLGERKMARNTARFDAHAPALRKPPWIRVRLRYLVSTSVDRACARP